MKLLVTSGAVIASLLLPAAGDRASFLPRGEVYEDETGEHRLIVRSWSGVLVVAGEEAVEGTFETLVDGRIKVTLETPGTPQSLYYLRVEQGLQEVDPEGELGRLLYDRGHIDEADSNPKRQKRTMARIRTVGTAWFSWLTDQLGAFPAGSTMKTYDLSVLTNVIDGDSLLETLFPDYIQRVPNTDGWGHDVEFRHADRVLNPQFMAIRSTGRDGVFESSEYPIAPFDRTDYDRDIVWADGFFIRYPGHPSD